MKSRSDTESQRTLGSWLIPFGIAFCAAGAGITGTLLWVQSRPSAPTAQNSLVVTPPATSTSPTSTSIKGNSSTTHEPPASLTAGMPPAQSALTLGNWHYDHKAWPIAITQYQKAIEGGLNNPNVRTDLGSAYRFSGQPQKALEQYRLAQKQDPQHEHSLFNQGGVYAFELKQPQKAIEIWRKYLQVFPNGKNVAQANQLIAEVEAHLKH